MSWTIKVLSHGLRIHADDRTVLSDRLQAAGIPISVYCNKRGLCGKCFVEVVSGEFLPPSAKEEFWIKEKRLGENFRLACQLRITGNLEIKIPAASILEAVPVLPNIARSAVIPDPAVRKYEIELARPEISSPQSLFDLITEGLAAGALKVPATLLADLPRIVEEGRFTITVAVHAESEIIAVEPGASLANLGLAVDIGTTTLVMDLVDLDSGRTIDTEAALNGQVRRGADVISRIAYAYGHPERAAELRALVVGTLNEMIARLLKRNGAGSRSVYEVVVSGNTVMSHLFLGVPVDTLAAAPYQAVFSRGPSLAAAEAGFDINPRARVYLSPNIMSFVGGDISSGIIASRLAEKDGNFLLIDLGTNGEIVLKTGAELLATSTAAGPAFEGMAISCGMPALPGAIYRARLRPRSDVRRGDTGTDTDTGDSDMETWAIGERPALGVCGTGLIDIAAIALARGEISTRGAVLAPEKTIRISDALRLTQDDIRQLQLSCAAVKSGVRLMLARHGLGPADLAGIYIAGAFGSYLNIENSTALGLLPRIDGSRLMFIGNSSLAGARLLLVSKSERERVEALVRGIRYVSLASDPDFQNQFIGALDFEPWP
jgi:uncharacterized 2Fe-2S/4Fe-4S cluster protein (DUF4445 family)